MRFKDFTTKQNIIVLGIIIFIIFCSSLPYLAGLFLAKQDYFMGGNYLNQADVNVYISNMEQVENGQYLLVNLFTSEPQKNIFFSPLWLFLGLVAKILKCNSILIFHLARIISAIGFLYFVFYYFLAVFFKKFLEKIVALVLICFSSGFGLLFNLSRFKLYEKTSVEFWVPEANTFLTLAHSSLFIITQFLIIFIFYLILKDRHSKFDYLWLFTASMFLGFVHPYDTIIVAAILIVFFVVRLFLKKVHFSLSLKQYFFYCLTVGLGFLPAILYFFFYLQNNQAIWGWFKQNICQSPNFFSYLIAYLPLIIFCGFSIDLERRNKNNKIYFLLCWIITIMILVYLPVSFQRRLISTLHIALAILATYSLAYLIEIIAKVFKTKLVGLVFFFALVLLFSLSNLFFLKTAIYSYQRARFIYYVPENFYQAAIWLKENLALNQAILSSALDGAILPALSARPVFVGHMHQTTNFLKKYDEADGWFFRDTDQIAAKKEFLARNNIKYIFYSQQERALGQFNLEAIDNLEKVYSQGNIDIYKVK
jgi:hypothetical protein